MITSKLSCCPLGTKDKTAATPGQPICHPPLPPALSKNGMAGSYGIIPMADGHAGIAWSSCLPAVVIFLLPLSVAMVRVVMGVYLPVEFSATLLDWFLAQLVSTSTVAPCPCLTGMWGNGPSGNCETVPPAPLVLAASQSLSITPQQQPHCLFSVPCPAKTS